MFKNLSRLKDKIIFDSLVTVAISFIACISLILYSFSAYREASLAVKILNFSKTSAEVIHQLQIERGLTAGFLATANPSAEVINKLGNHRTNVTSLIEVYNNEQQQLNLTSKWNLINQSIEVASSSIESIAETRIAIDERSLPLAQALGYYTGTIDKILNIFVETFNSLQDAKLTQMMTAMSSYAHFKDKAGIERALLNALFTRGEGDYQLYSRINSILGEEKALFSLFVKNAPEYWRSFTKDIMLDESYYEAEKIRDIAISNNVDEISKITASEWFTEQTSKINEMRKIENFMLEEIIKKGNENKFNQMSYLLISLAVLISFLLIYSYTSKKVKLFKQSKQINDASIEQTTVALMICTGDNKISFANLKARQMLGKFSKKAISSSLEGAELLQIVDFPNDFISAIEGKESRVVDFAMNNHNVRAHINPVFDKKNNYLAFCVTMIDRNFETMVEKEVQEILVDFEEGKLSNRMIADGKVGFFKQLAENINSIFTLVDKYMQEQSIIISAISKGDLSVNSNLDGKGVFGEVNSNINKMVGNLSGLLNKIKQSICDLDVTIQEISNGNKDLQLRNENQAGKLEEANANVLQISSSIKKILSLSQNVEKLAVGAKNSATDGGDVIKMLINNMITLESKFNSIESIVEVIENISFQTNLLSLNASVEAARAGQQGKGFAVVASEVRNLAERSSVSAKDIGNLIKDTVDIVDSGSELAGKGSTSLDEILQSVSTVSEKIVDVVNSIGNQSGQVDEISQFISSIESATQQNSALGEELSAASIQLAEQSKSIVDSLSDFKTN